MDGNANWRPTQGSDPAAAAAAAAGVDPNAPAGGDWRAQLQPEARSRIVNKMYALLIDLICFPLPSNHISSILLPPFLFRLPHRRKREDFPRVFGSIIPSIHPI
jgi:hypothetical protein